MGQQVRETRRPNVVGIVLHRPLANLVGGHPRRVLDHDRHRAGETVLQFREPGAHPNHDHEDFRSDDHVVEVAEQPEAHHRWHVLLGARRQEHNLVAQSHQHDQAAVGDQCPPRHRSGTTLRHPSDRVAGEEQHHHQPEHDELVETGVPRRAPAALRERDMVGIGRDTQRVVLPPVEDAADRGVEMKRQRAARGGQPHDLQQDRPDHQLLVQDRLVPPTGDVVKLKPLREGTADDQPEQRVVEDLPHVERDRLFWGAEALLDPVELQHLHPLEERHFAELVEVDRWQFGGSVTHVCYFLARMARSRRSCSLSK